MWKPERITRAVESCRPAEGFSVSEDPGRLVVVGVAADPCLQAWQEASDGAPEWLSLRFVDDIGDDVVPGDVVHGERFKVFATFACPVSTPHFFTAEGWSSLLTDDEAMARATGVRLAFVAGGFETLAFSVLPWSEDVTAVPAADPGDAGKPRSQVRSQAADLMAPAKIEAWILDGPDPVGNQAADLWKERSCEAVARSLPNELYREGGEAKARLVGQPPRSLDLGRSPGGEPLFRLLQDAGRWIYVEGRDVEVRHTFLSSELAREWRGDTSFMDGLETRLAPSLDSARLLYKAHLRTGSKDTLKSLSDLRKALGDDVQKLLQQAKDLSASVWRDVAVAIGVMAFRFALDATKASTMTVELLLIYAAVASYVVISFVMSVTTNRAFLRIVDASTRTWRTKLYGFLDDDDYRSLAEHPLREAVGAYRRTERRAAWIVVMVLVCLGTGAAAEVGWISWSGAGRAACGLRSFLEDAVVGSWNWLQARFGG